MKHQGFSLVELSIVLVILGLLTGGILSGRSLIKAAELRTITTAVSSFKTAVMAFKGKYFALPGDMKNATYFWDTMSGGTCPNATGGTGTQTCNGNGDGYYDVGNPNQTAEIFLFWQHLSNAGLVEGQYNGISGPLNGFDSLIGVNVPESRYTNVAGWNIKNDAYGLLSGDHMYTDGKYVKTFVLGHTDGYSVTDGAILTPEDTWNIDKKVDDGKPQRGKVWAVHWDDCTTATSSSDYDGEYALTLSDTVCTLAFINSF